VDTIIETSYFELDDVVFPLNELFGLVVEYENFNYEFLLKVVDDCSTLTVMSSGAFNKDTDLIGVSLGLIGGLGLLKVLCYFIMIQPCILLMIFMLHGGLELWCMVLKQISIIISKLSQK